ncbi:hypothetical protein PAPHI01_0911 [Pancytospora philotis]|nr:hypothetical protein PAPHI01_0911 [Pancytospora philotis]
MLGKILLITASAACASTSNPSMPLPCAPTLTDLRELCCSSYDSMVKHATELSPAIKAGIADYQDLYREVLATFVKVQQIRPEKDYKAYLQNMEASGLGFGTMIKRISSLESALMEAVSKYYALYIEAFRLLETVRLYMCSAGLDCIDDSSQLPDLEVFEQCDGEEKVKRLVEAGEDLRSRTKKMRRIAVYSAAAKAATDHKFRSASEVYLSHVRHFQFHVTVLQCIEQPLKVLVTSSNTHMRVSTVLRRIFMKFGGISDHDENFAKRYADEMYSELESCVALYRKTYDALVRRGTDWISDISQAITQARTREPNTLLLLNYHY